MHDNRNTPRWMMYRLGGYFIVRLWLTGEREHLKVFIRSIQVVITTSTSVRRMHSILAQWLGE